jgi:excisionase family DNA binding protein
MSSDQLLTVPQVALILQLGRTSTWALIHGGHIKSAKIGVGRKCVRVRQADLNQYIEQETTRIPKIMPTRQRGN